MPHEIMIIEKALPAFASSAEVQTRRETTWQTNSWFRTKSATFLWIPWIKRAISYVESQGLDAISGPYTGCIMASYKRNDARRACHIDADANPEAKTKWEEIKKEPGVEVIKEFIPSNHIPLNPVPGLYILGLITAEEISSTAMNCLVI